MEDEKNNDINSADDIIAWKVLEYTDNKKSKAWLVIAGIIAALLMIYAVFTANFAFAVFIALAIIVIMLRNKDEVDLIDVALTDNGVVIGKAFHDYDNLRNFAIVYKPDDNKKNLYFEFKSALQPRLSVPLDDMNPLLIRKNLLKYLEEDLDRTDLPLSEQLSRMLGL